MEENESRALVVIGAALSIVGLGVLFWMVRRSLHLVNPLSPPIVGWAPPPEVIVPETTRRATLAQSYNLLRGISIRVATAFPECETDVVILATSPPGGAAILAFDLATLNGVDPTLPIGPVTVVPVGSNPQTIRMNPGDALFAMGNQDGVLLSVTTSQVR